MKHSIVETIYAWKEVGVSQESLEPFKDSADGAIANRNLVQTALEYFTYWRVWDEAVRNNEGTIWHFTWHFNGPVSEEVRKKMQAKLKELFPKCVFSWRGSRTRVELDDAIMLDDYPQGQ
jgi:hypothetical protein